MKLEEINKKYLDYLTAQTKSQATIKGYNNDLKMFMRWLGGQALNDIEITDLGKKIIREYIDSMEAQGLAFKTVKRRITVLKAMLQYAYERDYIDENPFWKMKIRLRNDRKLPEIMEMGEINRYLYTVHNMPTRYSESTHVRDVAIIELLFSTGMRVAELAGLKKENWNSADRTFRYLGKGNKARVSYIENPEVMAALQKYMDISTRNESDYIFINKYGNPISTAAVREIVKKYRIKAHIDKNVTPHTFRRSFATLLIDTGMDITYVQKILGHSSIMTTQLYVRLSEQSTRKALRASNPRDYMSFY